jgi:hypothetical protein
VKTPLTDPTTLSAPTLYGVLFSHASDAHVIGAFLSVEWAEQWGAKVLDAQPGIEMEIMCCQPGHRWRSINIELVARDVVQARWVSS